MDADNSGKLDADEVAKLCKSMGKKLNQKGLQAAMADMDADGSGEVCAHDHALPLALALRCSAAPGRAFVRISYIPGDQVVGGCTLSCLTAVSCSSQVDFGEFQAWWDREGGKNAKAREAAGVIK